MEQFPQRSYYEAYYGYIEKLIQEQLGLPDFELDLEEGWSVSSLEAHTYTDILPEKYSDSDQKEVKRYIEQAGESEYPRLEPLLHELVKRGIIPPGNYLIEVY